MCLILFGWNAHPNYPLIVAANRDEFYARPTAAAHWWNDNLLLGGQDLESGGTWLGITPQGRFAALTNHRDFYNRVEGDRSRGLLVTDALASSGNPDHFLSQISEQQICYQPFNLLLADGNSLFCYESRNRLTKKITSGIHALSNADLDTEWPKVERGKVRLATAIRENKIDSESLFSILSNREKNSKDLSARYRHR